jgi:hypothetical protein
MASDEEEDETFFRTINIRADPERRRRTRPSSAPSIAAADR